jgi:DNA-binding beta-propeller fold protein YncE
MSEYLFPHRLTRRDFLRWTGNAGLAAGLANTGAPAAGAEAPVTIGSGKHTYTLDEQWGKLPQGMHYGYGCAVVVDARDRVYVTSRSANPCVAIFDKDGQLLETWGQEFATKVGFTNPDQVTATAHGLFWSKEADTEYLYWTENADGPKRGPRIGARVYKTDLKAKVLYTIGNVDKESSTAQRFNFENPTDVAVAPNGDIYVVDGYGSQLLHRFDKNFKLKKTVGGPGKAHGQFNTCHGIWISTLRKEPEVYVADRANNRVEIYSLDLTYLRTISGFRLPCCFYQHGGLLYVPEMGARVSILGPDDTIVARMGDGADVQPHEIQQYPNKFNTPHALALSSGGDLYVIEWVYFGRPRKFKHTPTA